MRTFAKHTDCDSHHIASFDGIRGVAVLAVLIGHAGYFHNGWVGVDLFFVLSGFLITGILRRSKGEPFYWRRFYLKRATRILPPLVLAISVAALLWRNPSPLGLMGYLLSLGNIVDITRFDVKALEHLWSLSVEEHFYFFWPCAVLLLSRRRLQWLLAFIVIASPLLRLAFSRPLPPYAPNPIYFLTPFRIDGIALGSLLALLLEQHRWQQILRKYSAFCALLASSIYLVLWTRLGHIHFFPYANSPIFDSMGYSLVSVTAFFVVAYARLRPEALLARLLRNRLLVGLGVISYGAYVYSWLLLNILWQDFPSLSYRRGGIIHLLVSVPLSALLFRYYERPIMLWGKRTAAKMVATSLSGALPPSPNAAPIADKEFPMGPQEEIA
jgi:peptidoglycan/LPS O-acetylase OafA/YrhL